MSERTEKIYETKNYDMFIILDGNRDKDERHVKQLMKLMSTNGNLTGDFPIIVNGNYEVIDGQHRIEALKRLEWPVSYVIKPDLTLQDVRAINNGHHNWSWLDYAESYAKLGNANYTRLLTLHNEYPRISFHTIMLYAGTGAKTKGRGADGVGFRNGSFILGLEAFEKSKKALSRYAEAVEAAEWHDVAFASAFYKVQQSEEYDHKRMLDKLDELGHRLESVRGIEANMRCLEDLYNDHLAEENKKRLF